jgi:putative cell wall-binding protein
VSRLAGPDRVATAAAVSEATFPGPVARVYVATAGNFPDALAAGPVAGLGGAPILLTGAEQLPAATAVELARLRPSEIVVLGGTAAVSDAVVAELGALASQRVRRLAGTDRYATAAAVSREGFADGADVVLVATGENFPDALAGGPLAARLGGPILLVARESIPAATAAELARLGPKRIVVLGGAAAVSADVMTALDGPDRTIERLAGPDRYATAAAVTAAWPDTAVSYVATGQAFPDALTAAPAAAIDQAPLMLVARDAIPSPVRGELERLRPAAIAVLGGFAAISAEVQAELAAFLRAGDPSEPGTPPSEPGTPPSDPGEPPPYEPGTPNTDQLIAEALEEGRIDAETALIYRVFAVFGDERLPAEFRSPVPVPGSSVLSEVERALDTLSAEAVEILTPFLLPAFYEDSWYYQGQASVSGSSVAARRDVQHRPLGCLEGKKYGPGWRSVAAVNGRALVWWDDFGAPGDAPTAAQLAHELTTTIWPRVTGAMGGREPQGDSGETGCHGPDAALDIILVPLGHTLPPGEDGKAQRLDRPGAFHGHGAVPSSGTIYIDRLDKHPRAVLAHEFMHAIQDTFPTSDLRERAWLDEAVANWAMHVAYPGQYLNRFFVRTRILEPLNQRNDMSEYDAWTWPLFIEARSAGVVRRIYDRLGSQATIPATRSTLGNRYASTFADYAVAYWNVPPHDGLRRLEPTVNEGMGNVLEKAEKKLDLQGEAQRLQPLAELDVVPELAAAYYRFEVPATVDGIRVEAAHREHLTIRALILTRDGTWDPNPRTLQNDDEMCTHRPQPPSHEDMKELVIIVVNGSEQPLDIADIRLELNRGCEWPDLLEGTLTLRTRWDYPYQDRPYYREDEIRYTVNLPYLEVYPPVSAFNGVQLKSTMNDVWYIGEPTAISWHGHGIMERKGSAEYCEWSVSDTVPLTNSQARIWLSWTSATELVARANAWHGVTRSWTVCGGHTVGPPNLLIPDLLSITPGEERMTVLEAHLPLRLFSPDSQDYEGSSLEVTATFLPPPP